VVAVVGLWLDLDSLGSRWFQALPEEIKRHGLIGLARRRCASAMTSAINESAGL
jgi:hypothetical protein